MIRLLLLTIAAIIPSDTLFTISSSTQSLTSSYTLEDGVSYDLNFTMPSASITSGSKTKLQFPSTYNINSSSLANCKASISNSVAPTTATCSVIANTGGSGIYEVFMEGMFPTTTTYSFLRLQFTISNPYA